MAVTKKVKKNVTNNVTKPTWGKALEDAQAELEKAKKSVSSWKATVNLCKKRIEENATWPKSSVAI